MPLPTPLPAAGSATATATRPAARIAVGLACLLAAWLSGCGSRGPDQRVALVIGNAAYESAPPLVNPRNDAADMCQALKRMGYRTMCHADVPDRAAMDALVQAYTDQLTPRSVGLVYYSGHGVQVGQANYLVPVRARLRTAREDPTQVMYSLGELFARLRERTPRFQLVILDACRTDLFGGGARAGGAGTKGAAAVPGRLEALPQLGNGLAPITNAPGGTTVLYATASGGAAFDGRGRNGPLTKHVLDHIGAQNLKLADFITRVTAGVQAETLSDYGRGQTPHVYGVLDKNFCLSGCLIDPIVPPAL